MRIKKKQIKDHSVITGLLTRSHVGRLGTIGKDGYPMIKPLNFVYSQEKIYFHSSREGEKIEDILRNDRVCFEVDLPITYVKSLGIPCKADYLYRSVIAKGRAMIVEDEDERLYALKHLMEKYQPEGGYEEFPKDRLLLTAIIRIDIEELTGKEDLGKDEERKMILRFLETDAVRSLHILRK